MSISEAIEALELLKPSVDRNYDHGYVDAIDTAIVCMKYVIRQDKRNARNKKETT